MHQSITQRHPPSTVIIDVLNRLLAHEINAAENYDACLSNVPSALVSKLESGRDSHVRRSAFLRHLIADLDGDAAVRADFLGSVTPVLMHGAKRLGATALLSLLKQCEDETMATYRQACDEVDQPTRDWLHHHCLSDQVLSQRVVRNLRRTVRAAEVSPRI